MAKGYIMDKALGFCIEYMKICSMMARCVWDDIEEANINDKFLEG